MKIKFLPVIATLATAFVACNDTLTDVGSSIQPGQDQLEVFTDTLGVDGMTVKVDSIYAKTYYGMLGSYTDKAFGTLESDYMCQFYCPTGLIQNPSTFVSIDSMDLELGYAKKGSWLGDKLAPMGVSVFELNKALIEDYYTNADPSEFCQKNILLGAKGYSVFDPTVPDSISSEEGYYPSIVVKLNQTLTDRFAKEYANNKSSFDNLNNFTKFFKGVYVEHAFGRGSIVNISQTQIRLYYTYKLDKKGDDHVGLLDSTAVKITYLPVTDEVIQMNHISNTDMDDLLSPEKNKTKTYLKSPAGLATNLTIPIGKMITDTKGAQINSLRLQFGTTRPSAEANTFKAPPYIMFIPKSEIKSFFEDKLYKDKTKNPIGKSVFVAKYDSTSYTYTFSNIAPFIKTIAEKYEKENQTIDPTLTESVQIIPVAVNEVQDPYSGQTSIAAVANYFGPSAIELLKQEFNGTPVFKTSLVWSQYKN